MNNLVNGKRGLISHRLFSLLALFSAPPLMVYAWNFWHMPLMGEDYAFVSIYKGSGFFENVEWILGKIYQQSTTWNARLGEQLAIFWLNVSPVAFLLAAVLAFVLLNFLLSLLFSKRGEWRPKFFISTGVVFLLWPGMEVFFWRTANAGYLQPIVLSLVCVIAFRDEERLKKLVTSGTRLLLVTVVAALAGYSFENVPIAISFYMFLSWVISPLRWHLWPCLFPVFAMLAGWYQLISMPSTQYRRAYYQQAHGVEDVGPVYWMQRALDVAEVFFETSGFLLLCALASVAFLFYAIYRYSINVERRALLTILPAFLVISSVAAAPYTEPRSFALAWVIMISFVVEALWQICRIYRYGCIILLLSFVASLYFMFKAAVVYNVVDEKFGEREVLVKEASVFRCNNGVDVGLISIDAGYKYFNNRDAWSLQNLDVLSQYYDCQLTSN